MDGLTTAIFGALPELGGTGALMVFVLVLMRWQSQASERFEVELKRQADSYDAERAELLEENTRLRGQRDDAETQLRAMWRHPSTTLEESPSPPRRRRRAED